MPNNNETNTFQCYCGEGIYEPYIPDIQQTVCQDLPFYDEYEGNQYCVLHHPSYEKEHAFEVVFQERLSGGDYDFRGVIFPCKINFSNYKFEKDVNFTYATFTREVDFSSANFSKKVLFQATRFWDKVNFFSATFLSEANFNSAEFSKKVDFWKAMFGKDSHTLFHSTRFHGDVSFYSATIKGYMEFESAHTNINFDNDAESDSYLNLCFSKETYLNLEKAKVEHPERLSFHTVRFHPSWLLNIDSRKFILTDIHWENADGSEQAIKDEIEHLKKREGARLQNPIGLLTVVYRQIAANAEEKGRHEEAAKFRKMVFESELLEKMDKGEPESPAQKRFRVLKAIYDLAKGDPSKKILYETIEQITKINSAEVTGILQYLEQHDLIFIGGEWTRITSNGIDQIETTRIHPEKPTSYFPANVFYNTFNGQVTSIQQGGQGNTVNITSEKTATLDSPKETNSTYGHIKANTRSLETEKDPKTVFVVHGRNIEARNSLFRFLRSIGLRPLEWSQAIKATGKASPFIGEILDVAFSKAQAVVVLMTPDDVAQLLEPFRSPYDPSYESQLTGQARPNVLFEAGMAIGHNPDRTVIIELGTLRPFSDIAGRHTVRLSNDSVARHELAQRLETAGCAVDLSGKDWHTDGDFNIQPNILRPEEAVSDITEAKTASPPESLGGHDQALSNLFLSEFPSQGKSAIFLRDHDLGSSFNFSELTEINNFLNSWDNAEHEFNNYELENKRHTLLVALKTFHRELSQHSSSTHREDWLSIGLQDMDVRKEMLDMRDRLNELGTKAFEAHQELVREIKRRL